MAFDKSKFVKSAEKYLQQGKVAAAISEYEKIVEFDPNDFNTINTLGDLNARIGQNKEAINYYLKVAESYQAHKDIIKAVAMYKKINKLDATNYQVCLKLADLYALQQHNVEAKQHYNIVLDAYKREGKHKQALQIMKTLAELEPDDIHFRVELAKAYKDQNMNNEAKEAFTNLGKDLLAKDRVNESIYLFQNALSIDNHYKPAYKGLVEGFAHNKEMNKAFAMLNDVLSKEPNDIEYLDLLGNIYLLAKDLTQAEATFGYLYQSDKSYYHKLIEVSHLFLTAGHIDSAITVIDRCLEHLIEIKEEGLATEILTDILKQDATHMQALRRLGYIYMSTQKTNNLISTLKLFVQAALSQGNKAEAAMALQQLLTLEPSAAEEAKAQLVDLKETEPTDDGIAKDPLLQTLNPLTTSNEAETPQPKEEPKKPTRSSTRTSALLDGMVNSHPEYIDSQIKLLEEMVVSYPEYLEARVKLKNSYLERGLKEKAAEQLLILGRMYETQGNKELAREMLTEGYKLSILTGGVSAPTVEKVPLPTTNQFSPQSTQSPFKTGAYNKAVANTGAKAAPTIKGRTGSLSGAYPKAPGMTGSLTGALSKSSADISSRLLTNKMLKKEWRRASRYSRLISLAIAKIDDFASYLETYGEEMAENCFKRVAETLSTELNRPGDELITYPGEGFAIVLPETPVDGATIVAERLRVCVEALSISHVYSDQWVTVSFGIASSAPTRNSSPEELVEVACAAQQQASIGGGNRVIVL
ncbi:MAG: diguanylate cyclase [Acidobacteria bacterium]|nr:diguanylate cyclase [Acidobacteriota bacterium]